jgi:hypothetical protein
MLAPQRLISNSLHFFSMARLDGEIEARDSGSGLQTVSRMDARVEPPWLGSRRVCKPDPEA